MNRTISWFCLMWAGGCVTHTQVQAQLTAADALIAEAESHVGAACAPILLADAAADAHFSRIELALHEPRRAANHASDALAHAEAAWSKTEPCAAQDEDGDTVPDIVDECPGELEDLDGDRDGDGCIDEHDEGDLDQDGIPNIDDRCIDRPEDFDGDTDEDGCPETSSDLDGDGVVDVADRCDDEIEDLDGFEDMDGCADPDNDGDGLFDARDQCPNDAEDRDMWQDDDGCPDPDNDGDGVLDIEDACPQQPGVADRAGCAAEDADMDGVRDDLDQCPGQPEALNGYMDDDGCPDTLARGVRVDTDRFRLETPIRFVSGGTTLDASARPILDEVARALAAAPNLRIRVEGHTDATGDERNNVRISQERAETVQRYLLGRGVRPEQVTAVGKGSIVPLATNATASGRARNRRVEFILVR